MAMKRRIAWLFAASGLSCALGMLIIGCAPSTSSTSKSAGEAVETKPWAMTIGEKGGAQLWSENCTRCHNSRSPSEFGDAQWDLVLMHMRTRANLTAEEARKIGAFMQSAN